MKKVLRNFAALFAVLLTLVYVMPSFAIGTADYNEHDVQKLRAFFEQAGVNGVKNGDKLFDNYNADDPATWVGQAQLEPIWNNMQDMVRWTDDGRLLSLVITNSELCGNLDLADCSSLLYVNCWSNSIESLDLGGCTSIRYIKAQNNLIESIDIDGVTLLWDVELAYNKLVSIDLHPGECLVATLGLEHNELTEIDISEQSELTGFYCGYNRLTSLRIPEECRELQTVWCSNNLLTEIEIGNPNIGELDCSNNLFASLDFSDIPLNYLDCRGCPLTELHTWFYDTQLDLYSAGHGTVSMLLVDRFGPGTSIRAFASPDPGYELDAWYDADGNRAFYYEEAELYSDNMQPIALTAVFEAGAALPGDVNNDGFVNANDALMVLRAALGLAPAMGPEADVDGDGFVNANDALLILRAALGLAEL